MKKAKKLPTIIGLIILFGGIAASVFLVKKNQGFSLRANPTLIPKQVKITNITEGGFVVSWVTDSQTSGSVKYSQDKNLSLVAKEDRDEVSGKTSVYFTHHVTLRGLKPNTAYYFKIIANDRTYDNNGQEYQLITAPPAAGQLPENDVAYGTVLKADGSPAEGTIVYLSLANGVPQSAIAKASGNWVIPLSIMRSSNLTDYLAYDREASTIDLFFQGGEGSTATAVTTTRNDSPVPAVTLGKNFDFRQQLAGPTPTENQIIQSNFNSQGLETGDQDLTIDNVAEGEKINTPKPEFVGTGPAGETITITVNSTQPITARAIVKNDGSWEWTLPSNLTPGDHTITISLANGTSIIRSFTVLAAGESDLPSFTASPSATISPQATPSALTPTATIIISQSPTPTPTIGIATRTSVPSTESGIPEPGVLTPTLMIVIMGLGLIFIGLFGYYII